MSNYSTFAEVAQEARAADQLVVGAHFLVLSPTATRRIIYDMSRNMSWIDFNYAIARFGSAQLSNSTDSVFPTWDQIKSMLPGLSSLSGPSLNSVLAIATALGWIDPATALTITQGTQLVEALAKAGLVGAQAIGDAPVPSPDGEYRIQPVEGLPE